MKTCSKCKRQLPEEAFQLKSAKTGKRKAHCGDCQSAYVKLHYSRKSSIYKRAVAERRVRNQEKVWFHLVGKSCLDCKEDNPLVLQFDHKEPALKSFEILKGVSNGYSWRRIEEEIEKCEIRCANCHLIRTSHQFFFNKVAFFHAQGSLKEKQDPHKV